MTDILAVSNRLLEKLAVSPVQFLESMTVIKFGTFANLSFPAAAWNDFTTVAGQ
jgi:hypothetical protein